MDAIEAERLDSAVITVEQMIDICLSPFHIDVNLLHTLLNIIASKLNLQTVRIHLGSPGLLTDINNLIAKSRGTFEAYRVLDGGNKKPFKLALCKLEKVNIEPDVTVDTFFKVTKAPSEGKDFHRVTFFKDSPITQEMVNANDVPQDEVGYTFAELLNMTKRLEGCEVGIEKLTHILQRLNINYKDLERSLIEISSKDHLKTRDSLWKQSAPAIDRCSQLENYNGGKADSRDPYSEKDFEARKDISRLRDTTANLIDQLNNLFAKIADFEKLIESLQNENAVIKQALEKAADKDKLDACLREVCNMQKSMAQFSDKMSDLIACSNRTNQRFKSINDQLAQVSKFRSSQEKIAMLEMSTQSLSSEFENFTERYEQIKVFKADREELDFVFQCKADKEQLQSLVPMDVFNSVRTDLSNGIVQAFDYIMQVEVSVWKGLEEVMSTKLEEKLDKSEKLAITKFVNDKLSCFQEKISEALGGRFNVKSAGTRTRALKDANCICCASEADIVCARPPLPKLMALRQPRKICAEPIEFRKRYCGGSHTVLNVEQKMSQRRSVRPFVEQNNEPPDTMPGASGAMYRVKKPECTCGQEKFPKILYPSGSTENKNKKPEENEHKMDAGDSKSSKS